MASRTTSTEKLIAQTLQAAFEHHQAGRFPEAEALYREVLRNAPKHPEALHYSGLTAYQQGKNEIAIELIRRAITVNPSSPVYYNNLGNALDQQGLLDEAAASFRKAISLKPDFAAAHNNLGVTLLRQGKLQEALASYREALSLMPDYHDAHNNLGNALKALGKIDEAIASYRQALSLRPDLVLAHHNLGSALKVQGKLDQAIASYQQALALRPDFAEAHNDLGHAFKDRGELDQAVASYRRALALKPNLAEAYSSLLFAIHFYGLESPSQLMAECDGYTARFETPLRAGWRPHQNSRQPGRRLKVGYLSADFRRHAVASFIEPVLANHDKDAFEIFCYYNYAQHDEVTDRLMGYADRWLGCGTMTDEQLARRIRADGIDILIDLAGHTAGNRMLTFARKPAPIQITYLGYPGTSGLSAMDYRLTDAHADPEGSEAFYTEKLLRLPDSFLCYRPASHTPAILPLPAQQNGHVTFGSFNNFNKIDGACIELWAELLREVPSSRLLMVTVPEEGPRRRLTERFAALGVPAERLELHGRLDQDEFHRMFQRADIALDSSPVGGGTTTCDTLWMGLPVVTLVGARCISRMGLSILRAVGLQDLAAVTREEYIRIAVDLARDLPRLADLHASLRARVAASPLSNEATFTRNLEKIYRGVWTQWCQVAA